MIYLLYACDEHKTYDSMRLVVATVYRSTLIDVINNEINKENMELGWECADLAVLPDHDLNTVLYYGFVQVMQDGEVQ